MSDKKLKVYCAGPLFNAKEREEMQELADRLEESGHETFLPQRDGLELVRVVEELVRRGLSTEQASSIASKAIFALDVYQVVVECDAIIVNLNGRVPDEGAVSEAAIAWCYGKIIIGYKADARSVFVGEDNPLVTGLFDFTLHSTFDEAVDALEREQARRQGRVERARERAQQISRYLDLGERIWEAANEEDRISHITDVLYSEAAPLAARESVVSSVVD